MYSAVLMAALVTAPTTQTWHRGHRCHGCYGGNGCHGTSCYVGANTCWYGSGSFGGGHGHHNGYHNGGYHNGYGVSGCYYGWGVGHPGTFMCNGCYGCYGGWSCYGYPPYHHALAEAAPPSSLPPVPERRVPESRPSGVEETPPPKAGKKPNEQARARVLIDVPAGAKLYVDDVHIPIAAGQRVFQTPNLIPGQTYFYDVRAEVVRDGRVVSASQRILLRPGQQAVASFADLGRRSDAAAEE